MRTPQQRNIRGVKKAFRETLPKYKNSLTNLRDWEEISSNIGDDKSLSQLWTSRIDFYKLYMPTDRKHTILEDLFNPNNDIDRLLKIIDENLPTMNSFYLATSFEAINDLMQLGICDIDTVIVSPEFKNLCKKTLLKLRFFEADEILKLINCLSTMRTPEDTLIVQSALQMARHLLNDFNSKELIVLKDSLDSFQITDNFQKSLLYALKQAASIRLTTKDRQHRINQNNTVSNLKEDEQIISK